MAISSTGIYNNAYEGVSILQKKETDSSRQKTSNEVSGMSGMKMETTKKTSNEEYLKSLQKQVPYVTLEIGSALSMQRDKRAGVITVNPKLLEKMKSDPEAAAQYTQKLKDIERAERIGNAYYNSLGGCVERTSHWYVDEEGNHYHFAITIRDDRFNKKISEEAKKNMEEHIEKTRKKAREKAEELKEKLDEKAEEARRAEKQEAEKKETEVTKMPADAAESGEVIENRLTVNEPLTGDAQMLEQSMRSGVSLDLEI